MVTGLRQPQIQLTGFHELSRKQLITTVIGLQLTLLLSALDQTIVSTAMPRIIQSLTGFDRYAWVTTAYMLTSTAAVPIFGKLSDIYGRKWFLLGGTIFFLATSALCGAAGYFPLFAPSPHAGMDQLILFRGMQGIAGGMLMALTFTVIGDIFPPAERGKYQGLFSAVWAFASVIGPTLGGWITDSFSWRWVFYVNLPVGAIALLALYYGFPYIRPAQTTRRIDYLGVITLLGFLSPMLVALDSAADAGWTSFNVLGLLGVALVMLVAFVFVESKAAEPIIPLSLFQEPIVRVCTMSLLINGIAMFGAILFIPLFMQTVIQISATESGSLLTPMMLMMTVGSVTAGQIASRTGRYKWLAITGSALMVFGMALLAQMGEDTTRWICVRNMMLVGLGLGLQTPIYTLAVQNVAEPRMIGAATATTQFFRSIGGTLGAAIFGSLMLARYLTVIESSLPSGISVKLMTLLRNPVQMIGSGAGPHTEVPAAVALAVRHALVQSLDNVFLVSAIIASFSLVLTLFLREVALRKTNAPKVAPPTPEAATSAAR